MLSFSNRISPLRQTFRVSVGPIYTPRCLAAISVCYQVLSCPKTVAEVYLAQPSQLPCLLGAREFVVYARRVILNIPHAHAAKSMSVAKLGHFH